MRYSVQRETVYDILCSTDTHPDAQWVYNRARQVMPTISLGTVYRNLSELCTLGKAKRISAVNNAERFDARTNTHAHFVCELCGQILDIEGTHVSNAVVKGHSTSRVEVVYYGTCNQCLNKS